MFPLVSSSHSSHIHVRSFYFQRSEPKWWWKLTWDPPLSQRQTQNACELETVGLEGVTIQGLGVNNGLSPPHSESVTEPGGLILGPAIPSWGRHVRCPCRDVCTPPELEALSCSGSVGLCFMWVSCICSYPICLLLLQAQFTFEH